MLLLLMVVNLHSPFLFGWVYHWNDVAGAYHATAISTVIGIDWRRDNSNLV